MADAINVCVWYVRKGIFHPVVFKPLRPPVGAQDMQSYYLYLLI
jgi:hypothetical protein